MNILIPIQGRMLALGALAAMLAACSGAPSTGALPATSASSGSMEAQSHVRQANCVTKVWASEPYAAQPAVIGYNAAGSVCQTLTAGNAINFGATYGLASDSQGYLYVTDSSNARVVVFDGSGAYWSTLTVSAGSTPTGVCVSRTGIVGVVSKTAGTTPSVEFYPSRGGSGSVSGSSSSIIGTSLHFCAFDKRGDFFTDRFGGQLQYLRYSNVNTAGMVLQTCVSTNCSGSFWGSMYSHIKPGSTNTLSIGDTSAHDIVNFKVNLGGPNLLTFVAGSPPTTALTNYPSGDMCQIAPTTGQGNASRLYVADCGTNVFQAPNVTLGGIVNLFATQSGSFGVATRPTGQY